MTGSKARQRCRGETSVSRPTEEDTVSSLPNGMSCVDEIPPAEELGKPSCSLATRQEEEPLPDYFPASEDPTKWRLICTVRNSVIGHNQLMRTPFGLRKIVYADYTASGRALTFIENFIQNQVLPYYANTHTETSTTGLQTTKFREDARQIIRDCLNCTEHDHVIFVGNGATGAINLLVDMMGLRVPEMLDNEYHMSDMVPPDRRPVVFVGPYEHHSNELVWRESVVDVVEIPETEEGLIDTAILKAELIRFRDRPLRIGSFSAASNVTGIESKTFEITALLHTYGALSFWDFAAAAPYTGIDMNPSIKKRLWHKGMCIPKECFTDETISKDAVFVSPHKFVGGPGSAGLLVVKDRIVKNRVPANPGGGTVMFVTKDNHHYLEEVEHREEGGTPNILGCIRAGMVFQLKRAVGYDLISKLENQFVQRAMERWSQNPRIKILGSKTVERLSIVAFVVRCGQRLLHHDFVVTLLDQIFGIQTRGGCSCAGPYGIRLLGVDMGDLPKFFSVVEKGFGIVKPGWVRLNFNYFISENEFQYVLDAVDMVAKHGWKLLPFYNCCPSTGRWQHCSTICPVLKDTHSTEVLSLSDIDFSSGVPSFPCRESLPEGPQENSLYAHYLDVGKRIFQSAAIRLHHLKTLVHCKPSNMPKGVERLRWFAVKEDVAGHPFWTKCCPQEVLMARSKCGCSEDPIVEDANRAELQDLVNARIEEDLNIFTSAMEHMEEEDCEDQPFFSLSSVLDCVASGCDGLEEDSATVLSLPRFGSRRWHVPCALQTCSKSKSLLCKAAVGPVLVLVAFVCFAVRWYMAMHGL